ncbi:MAG: methyltransferase domain-containing protein [Coriobacteriia bacterium]|nr:methyltransferase domain-containing protein [Coriobacteriia bacterium]
MGFFNWAAPLVRRYGDRFTAEDAGTIAEWLRPAVTPGGHMLDVGGGAGQLAALLAAALDAHVTVLDPTAEMVAHVPTSERVIGVQGTAEAMPLPDNDFDAIVVTDAFHHFRDQGAAVAEFARVVRDGGLVLVLDLDPRPLSMRLIRLGEMLLGEPGTFMTPEQMCAFMSEHGVDGECEPLRKADYRFLGTVRKTDSR